jgi:DNA-binding IscR family transcriptional regulator
MSVALPVGIFFTRRPEEITVGDIIRAVEGKDIQLVDRKGDERGRKPCDRLEKCVIQGIWGEALDSLKMSPPPCWR